MQVIELLLEVPVPLPVPLLLIENVGKIDPLGEQLAVSSVMVEVIGLKLAVTCAEAAPEPRNRENAGQEYPGANRP